MYHPLEMAMFNSSPSIFQKSSLVFRGCLLTVYLGKFVGHPLPTTADLLILIQLQVSIGSYRVESILILYSFQELGKMGDLSSGEFYMLTRDRDESQR